MKSAIYGVLAILGVGKSTSGGQRKRKCVAKSGFYPYFGVKVGIKNDTVNDTIVSFTVSVMGWVMGFSPGLKIARQLSIFPHPLDGSPSSNPITPQIPIEKKKAVPIGTTFSFLGWVRDSPPTQPATWVGEGFV